MYLVSRVGRKYAIYLPKSIVRELNISEGDRVIITLEEGKIIIKPVKKFLSRKKYWTEISAEEIEEEGENLTRFAEND